MNRTTKCLLVVLGVLLFGVGSWFILLQLDESSHATAKQVSIVWVAIVIGLVFAFIGWPNRDIPIELWPPLRYRARTGRIRLMVNIMSICTALYGGLFFYIAGQIGHGLVFGMNFTGRGIEGNLYAIAFIGCFFSLYLTGFAHIEYAVKYMSANNIMSALPFLIFGAIGATVFAMITKSPFFAFVFISRLFGGIVITQLQGDDLVIVGLGLLVLGFIVLPICASLSA